MNCPDCLLERVEIVTLLEGMGVAACPKCEYKYPWPASNQAPEPASPSREKRS